MTPDPADFASLLEKEPPLEKILGSPTTTDWCGHCGRGWSVTAKALVDAKKTNDSAAARIKSLESVLVVIRIYAARTARPYSDPAEASAAGRDIIRLITETLDPCEPWCVRDESGHPGACEPHEDDHER